MIKIVHLADVHIRNIGRYEEYEQVFKNLYDSLKTEKPNIICVVGDLFESYIDISNEAKVQSGTFLNNLTLYCDEVIVVSGNHDFRKKNKQRLNSIETLVKLIENPKIKYFDKSGFFEDEFYPITWSNFSHLEKHIDPWKNITHTKDKNRLYIDLFHDPVNGAVNDLGFVFNKPNMKKITDFKGDISMFGDLHKSYQILGKNKLYPGSLIQQNFGELSHGHGVVVWEIDNNMISHRFIEIPNDYAFVSFKLTSPIDYDNLSLSSPDVVGHNKFRVVWTDYSANINRENEWKIKRYLKDKYDVDDVRFQKFPFHTNIEDSKMISEVININDNQVQQSVIREYLTNNNHDEKFIEEIIKIDDIVNGRIETSGAINIVWNIDKIQFTNFKSYGDDNVLDIKDINGIIQINGINQYGKSTILDVICYALYGKTLATTKREKHGDNRFINNKRDLDFCEASVVIDINGEKFLIHRRTERELDSRGEISRVSTSVNYYEGDHISVNSENKMDDETAKRTQKLIQEVLGDFDDFIRLALTNADNLNQLLSMDRSVFIDSVVKDAGYEIFEKKLDEFKKYKKELNLEKIVLDPIDVEEQIRETQTKIDESLSDENRINDEINDTDIKISKGLAIQEKLTLKIHQIDDDIMNLNVDNVTYEIETDKKKVSENEVTINEYKKIIEGLPDEFDYRKFNDDVENKSKFEKEHHEKELEVVKWEKMIGENNFKIDNVDVKINMAKKTALNEKKNQISILTNTISTEKNKINSIVNEKIRLIDKNVTILYADVVKLDNELLQLKSEGMKINQDIKSFEDAKNGEKVNCPTCNRPMEDCDEDHLNEIIEKKKQEFTEISNLAKPKIQKKKELTNEIESLKSSKTDFDSDEYLRENIIEVKLIYQNIDTINSQIKNLESEINNFDINDIKDEIDRIMTEKSDAEKENKELRIKIDTHTVVIRKLKTQIDDLEKIINEKNLIKKGLEKRKDYIIKMNKLSQDNNTLEKEIQKNETLLVNYNKNLKKIEENKETNVKIDQSRVILKQLNDKKNELIDKKIVINNMITLYRKTVDDMKDILRKYEEQILREELHNVYIGIMSRTGLPTYLLKKNTDLLNSELSTLLSITNFDMFFDDNLNYKLEHNGLPGTQNAIESSGMERTFAALVLKVVLRTINFRSKPAFIFLDEVINRLYGESVDKFVELLGVIKEKIDKIVIIEHNNEIMADMVIDVKKDANGISRFEIIQ